MDLPTILALLLITLTTFGCAAPTEDVGATRAATVYGTDDRVEYYDARPTYQDHVRASVVAFIDQRWIDDSDREDIRIDAPSAADRGVCVEHPFAQQEAAADCTGTLIDDDLVLTAGHCVDEPDFCDSHFMVFDYYLSADGRQAPMTADSIYRCVEVVDMEFGVGEADWAVLRLNAAVSPNRHPVPVQHTHGLMDGEPVWGAGFSNGTPAKLSTGDVVHSFGFERFYKLRIDMDAGNSGSGILDASGTLVGIYVSGPVDEDRGSCEIGRTFSNDEEERLSTMTSAHLAVRAVCDAGLGSPILCDAPVPHDAPLDEAPVADERADRANADASVDPMEPAAGGGCSATDADDAGPLTTLGLLGLVGLLGRRRERR